MQEAGGKEAKILTHYESALQIYKAILQKEQMTKDASEIAWAFWGVAFTAARLAQRYIDMGDIPKATRKCTDSRKALLRLSVIGLEGRDIQGLSEAVAILEGAVVPK
jgi:hypothetical protein